MRKSSFLWIVGALLLASPALADNVDHFQVTQQDGATVVALSGHSNSLAAEIFAALKEAGLPGSQQVDGQTLHGKLIQATVYYLNGAVYEANLTLDSASSYGLLPNRCAPASACQNSSARLLIGGDLALELYGDLVKAGDPEIRNVIGGTVRGKALACSYSDETPDGVRYSCALTLSERSLSAW